MNKEETTTTAVAIADKPLGTVRNTKYRVFDVSSETFSRFQIGRTKYERWSKFINENERDIVSYYNKNKSSVIVLRNSENGALRALYHSNK
jgi:hypothetical protein